MEVLIFVALLFAFILIGFAIRAASLRKITEDVTQLMVAEHFGVHPEPDGLKKLSKLQSDHPELYRKAQVAVSLLRIDADKSNNFPSWLVFLRCKSRKTQKVRIKMISKLFKLVAVLAIALMALG